MTFFPKMQTFIRNLRILVESIYHGGPQTGVPALCGIGPSKLTAPTPRSTQSILEEIFEPILYAVPRNRRTVQRRRMRQMSLPLMANAIPKKNIVICLNCGHPHERETICGKCYEKVRKETERMKVAMGEDKFYYDHPRAEVSYLYKGEEELKELPKYKGRYLVEIDDERPNWFSQDLMKKVKGET